MRLADNILRRAQQSQHPADQDFAHWAPTLRIAQCFEIDASVGELAHAMFATNPVAALIRTRDFAALPSQATWIEWRGSSAEMGPSADDPPRPGTITPSRCGVLVEVDKSLRRGVAHWVWELPGLGNLEPCPISVTFDWRPVPAEVPDMIRAACAARGEDWDERVREHHAKSRFSRLDVAPLLTEERRFGLLPNPRLPATWKTLDLLAATDPAKALHIVKNVRRDLENEGVFLVGLVVAMNTTGLLDIAEPPDMTRLNAARRKRGRTELLSFRRVTASGRNVIRLSGRGGAIETMRGFHAA